MAFLVYLRIKNDGKVNNKVLITENEIFFTSPENRFQFQYIFDQNCTQNEVFRKVAAPLLNEAVVGDECCILAHGVSGSGKTYTIEGTTNNCSEDGKSGIIKRACFYAFECLKDAFLRDTKVSVSYIEIYNEKIYNLLDDCRNPISIRDDARGVTHLGLTEVPVSDVGMLLRYAEIGMKNRIKKATVINIDSSRSHSIFTLSFKNERIDTSGKIRIVDLAGAETLFLKDSKQIVKSLSSLVDVVQAVVKKESHIPFRNSVLTRILKKSLSGEAKNAIICTLSMDEKEMSRAMNTVKFGALVGSISASSRPSLLLTAEQRAELELQEQVRINAELMANGVEQLMRERDDDLSRLGRFIDDSPNNYVNTIRLETAELEREIALLEILLRESDETTKKLKEEAKNALGFFNRGFDLSSFSSDFEQVVGLISTFETLLMFDPAKFDELKYKREVFVLFKKLDAKMSRNEVNEMELPDMPEIPDAISTATVQESLELLNKLKDSLKKKQPLTRTLVLRRRLYFEKNIEK